MLNVLHNTRFIFLLLLAAAAAFAQGVQNMEVIFLVGASHTPSETIGIIPPGISMINAGESGGIAAGTTNVTTEVGFGYQVKTFTAGSLYLELPLFWSWRGSGSVEVSPATTSVSSISRNSWYALPGAKWKIPTGTRLSFYAAFGGGVAVLHQQQTFVAPSAVTVSAQTATEPVVDFGGGIDLRVNRWLSLRLDARDYVHNPGFGATGGLNHLGVLAGVAFHF